jgi:hypothetical protein
MKSVLIVCWFVSGGLLPLENAYCNINNCRVVPFLDLVCVFVCSSTHLFWITVEVTCITVYVRFCRLN